VVQRGAVCCSVLHSTLTTTNVHDMNVLLDCVNSHCQWAVVKINMGQTEVTGSDYKWKCPLDFSILQLGNGKPKIVMPWDPVKYLGVRLTMTGDLTFERDYVRKKTLDTVWVSSSWPSTCTTLSRFTGWYRLPLSRFSGTLRPLRTGTHRKLSNLKICGCVPSRKHGKSMPACQTWHFGRDPNKGAWEHQRLEPSSPVRPSAFWISTCV